MSFYGVWETWKVVYMPINSTGVGGDVVIPDGVTAICKNAFAYKENLKHLHVPARVKYITGRK